MATFSPELKPTCIQLYKAKIERGRYGKLYESLARMYLISRVLFQRHNRHIYRGGS